MRAPEASRLGPSFRPMLLVALHLLAVCPCARAQTDTSAVARQLFDRGRRLLQEQRYAEACSSFQESQRLEPGGGTLLNLALCYELSGKTATAWATFRDAARIAERDARQDRKDFAEQHIAALTSRLSYLHLVVPDATRVPGLRILHNGTELGEPAWGERLPANPGEQVLDVTAPSKRPLRLRVVLRDPADVQAVVVPPLEPALVPPPSAPKDLGMKEVAATGTTRQRTFGLILSGLGVASLGLGSFFGIRAITRKNHADELCPNTELCDPKAFSVKDDAVRDGHFSTAFLGGGAALLGAGSVLVLTAPDGRGKPSARVDVTLRF